MEKQIQYFQIANLIFSMPYNQTTVLIGAELDEIQKRFSNIVTSFEHMMEIHIMLRII